MITPINTLKSFFLTGLRPLQAHYHALLDSYWHKSDAIGMSSISGLDATLQDLATTEQLNELAANIVPVADTVAATGKSFLVGTGKLLELLVVESNTYPFSIEIQNSIGDTILDEVQDVPTAVYRLDYYMGADSSIVVYPSVNVNIKIYKK